MATRQLIRVWEVCEIEMRDDTREITRCARMRRMSLMRRSTRNARMARVSMPMLNSWVIRGSTSRKDGKIETRSTEKEPKR